jgi:hypothetical protein
MKTRSRFGRIVAGLLLGVSIFVLIQPLPVEALKEYAIGSSSIKPRLDNSVNAAIIYVDDDFDESTEGWEIDRFAAIQPAIDIAEVGDVVQVAPGDYPGQLVIDKDLTLTGSNKASRILATAYMESYFTTSYPNYPVVCVEN